MTNNLSNENKKLKQAVTSLQATLDNVGSYIFTKDLDGRYTYANKLVQRIFNASLKDIIGQDDSQFFSLEQSNELRVNDLQVLKEGKRIEGEERNVLVGTGEARYFWTVKQPVYNDDNQIIGLLGISTDITLQKLLEQQLKDKQNLLDTVLNNMDAYIYMKDKKRRFLYVNQKTEQLFQRSSQEVLGKTTHELQGFNADFEEMDKQVLDHGKTITGEEEIIDDHGNTHYYWSNKVPLTDDNNEVNGYIGFSHDITELITLKKELEKKATTDDLTHLANRRYIFELADITFKQSIRSNQPFSILLLDLDYFKRINDNYGHPAGDHVLITIAKTIKATIRANDRAGRIGGEEFFIILPDTKSLDALLLAERLRKEIEKLQISYNNEGIKISTSIGISQSKKTDTNISPIIQRADSALYQAKSAGRNKVEIG